MSATTEQNYAAFLSSRCRRQWERIGAARRAGVCAPLFSLFSKSSVGIGEIPDLNLLAGWCGETGLSIIQLLPMNDVGFDYRPYDSQSSFALEPMYLSLENLAGADLKPFRKEIAELRRKFPAGAPRVNYGVKAAKLSLLQKIFDKSNKKTPPEFEEFCRANRYWIEDYALFKVIKEIHNQAGWESWPAPHRRRDAAALEQIHLNHFDALQFHKWLQWQLALQMAGFKNQAQEKGILVMGDLPFLVSRDSADVWARQNYFNLDCSSGAPPDLYHAKGQRWGMPPYRWPAIAAHHHDYLVEKLRYAARFYDCFRIDHFVGIFRIWTVPADAPAETGGAAGHFDPPDPALWEGHGRAILDALVAATPMLPCAEDLGTIPDCSWRVLEEYGIPGTDVQRWSRDWNGTLEFTPPGRYRRNGAVNISTHDLSPLAAWWEKEAVADEREKFWKFLELPGKPRPRADAAFARRALEKAAAAASVFSIQLLQDWLALDPALLPGDPSHWRINTPGTLSPNNWSVRLPFPLETLQTLAVNSSIRQINRSSSRA